MSFGLTNSPHVVMQGLSDFSCWYLDDILIHSKPLEEHKIHLQQVFDWLRKLKLKLKKCSFLQPEATYLGFVIKWNQT